MTAIKSKTLKLDYFSYIKAFFNLIFFKICIVANLYVIF